MIHTSSNLNISKKNKHIKSSNKNNFNKSSKTKKNNISSKINFTSNFCLTNSNNNFYNSLDFPLTKTTSNKINNQLHLPYKETLKSSIIINNNQNKNKKYSLKISNSNKIFSFNDISSKSIYTTTHKKRHNIRLNLNNKIKNKDFSLDNNRRISRKNTDIFFAEKIKEKNNMINKLKKDLFMSEMVLNDIRNNDKILETIDYDNDFEVNNNYSIKNFNNNKNGNILTLNFNKKDVYNLNKKITNIGPFLTFNYINNNFISYNKNDYNKSFSPKNKTIYKNKYFYSLPNSNHNKYDNNESLSSKKKNKNNCICIKKTNIKDNNFDFKIFVEKCNDLKNKSKNILNKYCELSKYLSQIKKQSK